MASCSLGTSNFKLSKLDFGRARNVNLQPRNDIRTCIGRKELLYAGVTTSYEPKKMFLTRCGAELETEVAINRVETLNETKSSDLTSQLIPNSSEVESLVTEICNTTSIAEFELKLGGFQLYVRRNLPEKNIFPSMPPPTPAPPPALIPAFVSTDKSNNSLDINESTSSTSSTSLTISKPVEGNQSLLDRAADEGLMILLSPRVGFFRRSRTVKGKRAPPSCKDKQIVKEGQVLCYIEQLGGELPIESDVSGEVIKILREDGEPVGYGDALIAILPSFPGIKKLQ